MDVNTMVMTPLQALLTRLASFLPLLLAALLIFVVAWLAARILEELLVRGLKAVRLDEIARRVGLEEIFRKGGVTQTLSELLGVFLYWFVLFAGVVAAVNALQLTVAAELLDRVLLYVPSVLAGVIILVLGAFFASLVGSLVQTLAANAGVTQARLLGQITRVVLVVFAIEVALEKFIGVTTLHMQLNIVIAAIAFGAALAFGLGCKDLAGRFMSDLIEKVRRG